MTDAPTEVLAHLSSAFALSRSSREKLFHYWKTLESVDPGIGTRLSFAQTELLRKELVALIIEQGLHHASERERRRFAEICLFDLSILEPFQEKHFLDNLVHLDIRSHLTGSALAAMNPTRAMTPAAIFLSSETPSQSISGSTSKFAGYIAAIGQPHTGKPHWVSYAKDDIEKQEDVETRLVLNEISTALISLAVNLNETNNKIEAILDEMAARGGVQLNERKESGEETVASDGRT